MEAVTSKGPVTISGTDVVEGTDNYAALIAVLQALKRLTKPCELDIYTDSSYVEYGIKEDAVKWQQAGWKTTKGKDVSHKEEWQEILKLLEDHTVTVIRGKIHEYYFWLRNETRRKAGDTDEKHNAE